MTMTMKTKTTETNATPVMAHPTYSAIIVECDNSVILKIVSVIIKLTRYYLYSNCEILFQ